MPEQGCEREIPLGPSRGAPLASVRPTTRCPRRGGTSRWLALSQARQRCDRCIRAAPARADAQDHAGRKDRCPDCDVRG